nr:MAG: hypothetical protein [uncultured archaeon]
MVNLNKWGIHPNFKPKHVDISFKKYTKKKAKMSVIPKNGRSFPLFKKAGHPFEFKGKKLTHTITGNFSLGQAGKRKICITDGFQIIILKN